MDMRHDPVDARELLVVVPAFVGVGLGELRELRGPLRVGALEDREPGLGGDEVDGSGSTAWPSRA